MKVKKLCKHISDTTICNVYSDGDLLYQGRKIGIKKRFSDFKVKDVGCGTLCTGKAVLWIELW